MATSKQQCCRSEAEEEQKFDLTRNAGRWQANGGVGLEEKEMLR